MRPMLTPCLIPVNDTWTHVQPCVALEPGGSNRTTRRRQEECPRQVWGFFSGEIDQKGVPWLKSVKQALRLGVSPRTWLRCYRASCAHGLSAWKQLNSCARFSLQSATSPPQAIAFLCVHCTFLLCQFIFAQGST